MPLAVAKPLQPPHQLRLGGERVGRVQQPVQALVVADWLHAQLGAHGVLARTDRPGGARGEAEHGEVGVGEHA